MTPAVSQSGRTMAVAFPVFVILVVLGACGRSDPTAPLADIDRLVEKGTAVMAEVEADVERETSRCMRERGFAYDPGVGGNIGDANAAVVDSRSERERVGFGYVVRFESLLGRGTAVGTQLEPSANELEAAALSPTDQKAYDAALWGRVDNPWSSAEVARDPEQSGCYNASWVELFGFELVTAQHRLVAEQDRVDAESASDPAVLAARDEWRRCLAQQSVDVEPDELDIEPALLRAVEELAPWLDPAALLSGDPAAIEDLVAHANELGGLKAREIEFAVADYDCAESVRTAQSEVRAEAQRSWLRSNPEVAGVLDEFYAGR